jgi:hypothetical protein
VLAWSSRFETVVDPHPVTRLHMRSFAVHLRRQACALLRHSGVSRRSRRCCRLDPPCGWPSPLLSTVSRSMVHSCTTCARWMSSPVCPCPRGISQDKIRLDLASLMFAAATSGTLLERFWNGFLGRSRTHFLRRDFPKILLDRTPVRSTKMTQSVPLARSRSGVNRTA